jgi:signal transduction histidine kinase
MLGWLRKIIGGVGKFLTGSLRRIGTFFRSIRFRLTLWYLLILAIVLILFSGFVYTRQRNDLRAAALDRLALKSRQLDGLYHALIVANPGSNTITFPDISSSGTALIQENEVLALINGQGQTIQKLGPITNGDLSQIYAAISQTNSDADTFTYPLEISTSANNYSQENYYFVATPILFFNRQVIAFMVLGVPIDPGGQLQRLLVTLILASLGTLALALLGGYWLAGRAMRPVQVITWAAREISETDLSRRLNLKTGDELGELADTFDAMLNRLQAAFDRQRQFTADASHELRTPLTIVNLEATRVLGARHGLQEYERALKVIHSENEFMTRLVNNLLTLARMDAGQASLKLENVDLGDIALEIVERLSPLAARQSVELIPGELPETHVWGDRQYLLQMVANLVENAIKYCQAEHKKVTIETGIQDRQAWVRVEDNGPGIAQEFIPHLFDRFYRMDKARSHNAEEGDGGAGDDQSGTGLGLSIVKWISEAHQGRVSVTSEVGKGSIFEVTLPLHPAPQGLST